MSSFMAWFMILLLSFVSFLLVVVVLLQRGRGGGLAGAFGGAGGQSAFGTKAGDVFTRITVVMAIVWVMLSGFTGWAMQNSTNLYPGGSQVQDEMESTGEEEDTDKESGTSGAGAETKPVLPTAPAVGGTDKSDADTTETDKTDADTADTDKPDTDADTSNETEDSNTSPSPDTTSTEDDSKKDE